MKRAAVAPTQDVGFGAGGGCDFILNATTPQTAMATTAINEPMSGPLDFFGASGAIGGVVAGIASFTD